MFLTWYKLFWFKLGMMIGATELHVLILLCLTFTLIQDHRNARQQKILGQVIMIIIITFKGTIRDFLRSPHCATNCLQVQHVHSSGPGAIVCKSCATHLVLITWKCFTCHVVRRASSAIKFDKSWNRIYLSFILLAEPLNRWRRGGNWSARRKPLATSFRKVTPKVMHGFAWNLACCWDLLVRWISHSMHVVRSESREKIKHGWFYWKKKQTKQTDKNRPTTQTTRRKLLCWLALGHFLILFSFKLSVIILMSKLYILTPVQMTDVHSRSQG